MFRRITLVMLLASSSAVGQEPPVNVSANAPATAMSVYLDCETYGCDFDYFRTGMTMVNWVRDRQVADLHVLVTTEQTGAGGRAFTVTFMGLKQFLGLTDTLKYVSPPASTEDDIRKGLAGVFRLGLVRYFARTPAAQQVAVDFGTTTAQGVAQTTAKKDRWKAWVFRTGFNGFGYGEEQYKDFNVNFNFNADRVTEQWKTRFNVSERYSETRNTYPVCNGTPSVCVDTTDINVRRGYNASILQVKSLGKHISAGLRLVAFSSTYENYKNVVRVLPAIEYDVFPYSQSTRQQLTLEYNLGYGHFVYDSLTVYDKESESMPMQRVTVGLKQREPWGSIDVSSGITNYLQNRELYRISSYGELSLRLIKGFEISAFGGYDRIKDQFNLRKGNFTPEQILTREFQLGTAYSFYTGINLSYTFGSIFNNVVNPRMVAGNF
ncbi:MAG: hypothetical protein ACRENU_11025 [Gemmatimonadaceae bacterium]